MGSKVEFAIEIQKDIDCYCARSKCTGAPRLCVNQLIMQRARTCWREGHLAQALPGRVAVLEKKVGPFLAGEYTYKS